AREQVLATVMARSAGNMREGDIDPGRQTLARAATLALERIPTTSDEATAPSQRLTLEELVQAKAADAFDAVETEAVKGYSIAFVGIDRPIYPAAMHFEGQLQRLVEAFGGPLAIALNGTRSPARLRAPLNILLRTGGPRAAPLATEVALAVAKASDGRLTALHVFDPHDDTQLLRGRARRLGLSLLVDARRLGKRSGVSVRGVTVTNSRPEIEIRR